MESFRNHKFQFVVMREYASPHPHIKSGVSQGSVLGPLLFGIYINGIDCGIQSNVGLFANECVSYLSIKTQFDWLHLQNVIENISDWWEKWQMRIYTEKAISVTFSIRYHTNDSIYKIKETPIEKVTSLKYLGVHFISNLTWNRHIDHVTSKSSKTLSFIKI